MGRAGIGLLLLRAAVGLTVVVQSGAYLFGGRDQTMRLWVISLLGVASGALLLIGFLTPFAGGLLGLSAAACTWFQGTANVFDNRLSILFVAIVGAAIVLLGPGAYSLDARLFGRREIIIPKASGTRKP
jgi:hypothetical protein